jgi:hypothetical protein
VPITRDPLVHHHRLGVQAHAHALARHRQGPIGRFHPQVRGPGFGTQHLALHPGGIGPAAAAERAMPEEGRSAGRVDRICRRPWQHVVAVLRRVFRERFVFVDVEAHLAHVAAPYLNDTAYTMVVGRRQAAGDTSMRGGCARCRSERNRACAGLDNTR